MHPVTQEHEDEDVRNEESIDVPRASEHLAVGRMVEVASRTWPGMNKPGGVARVLHCHCDGTADAGATPAIMPSITHVDVRYIVGNGKELMVPVQYVVLAPQFESGEVIGSSRRATSLRDRSLLLGRCKLCGSLRTDCGSCDWKQETEIMMSSSPVLQSTVAQRPKLRRPTRRRSRHRTTTDSLLMLASNQEGPAARTRQQNDATSRHHPSPASPRLASESDSGSSARSDRDVAKKPRIFIFDSESDSDSDVSGNSGGDSISTGASARINIGGRGDDGGNNADQDTDAVDSLLAASQASHEDLEVQTGGLEISQTEKSQTQVHSSPPQSPTLEHHSHSRSRSHSHSHSRTREGDLEGFIQPEGAIIANMLPTDVEDLTRSIDYGELPDFFERMATELEASKIPKAKSKVTGLQRRVEENTSTRRQAGENGADHSAMEKYDDDTDAGVDANKNSNHNESSTRNCDENQSPEGIMAEIDRLESSLIQSLIRSGLDQCLAALRKLTSRTLYKRNKAYLTDKQRKRCRSSMYIEARELRTDSLERSVDGLMSDLKDLRVRLFRPVDTYLGDFHSRVEEEDGGHGETEGNGEKHDGFRSSNADGTSEHGWSVSFNMSLGTSGDEGFVDDPPNPTRARKRNKPFHRHMYASTKRPSGYETRKMAQHEYVGRQRRPTAPVRTSRLGRQAHGRTRHRHPAADEAHDNKIPSSQRQTRKRKTTEFDVTLASLLSPRRAETNSATAKLTDDRERPIRSRRMQSKHSEQSSEVLHSLMPSRPLRSIASNSKKGDASGDWLIRPGRIQRSATERMEEFLRANGLGEEHPEHNPPRSTHHRHRHRHRSHGHSSRDVSHHHHHQRQRRRKQRLRSHRPSRIHDPSPPIGHAADSDSADGMPQPILTAEDAFIIAMDEGSPVGVNQQGDEDQGQGPASRTLGALPVICNELRSTFGSNRRTHSLLKEISSRRNRYPAEKQACVAEAGIALMRKHGCKCITELIASNDAILPVLVKLLAVCIHAVMACTAADIDQNAIVKATVANDKQRFLSLSVLQLVDSLYALSHPTAWCSQRRDPHTVLKSILPLRDALATYIPLTEYVSRAILTTLQPQRWWKSCEDTGNASIFVSSIDPTTWRCVLFGLSNTPPPDKTIRLSSLGRNLPQCEVDAIWAILACTNVPNRFPDLKSTTRWQLIARIYAACTNSTRDDKTLPPGQKQLATVQGHLLYFAKLLAGGALGSVPPVDTLLVETIKAAVFLQVDSLMSCTESTPNTATASIASNIPSALTLTALQHCQLPSCKTINRLIHKFRSIRPPDFRKEIAVLKRLEKVLLGPSSKSLKEQESLATASARFDRIVLLMFPKSRTLALCGLLCALWISRVPQKKARRSRLSKALKSLRGSFVERIATTTASYDQGPTAPELTFEQAFEHVGAGRTNQPKPGVVSLRHFAAMLLVIESLAAQSHDAPAESAPVTFELCRHVWQLATSDQFRSRTDVMRTLSIVTGTAKYPCSIDEVAVASKLMAVLATAAIQHCQLQASRRIEIENENQDCIDFTISKMVDCLRLAVIADAGSSKAIGVICPLLAFVFRKATAFALTMREGNDGIPQTLRSLATRIRTSLCAEICRMLQERLIAAQPGKQSHCRMEISAFTIAIECMADFSSCVLCDGVSFERNVKTSPTPTALSTGAKSDSHVDVGDRAETLDDEDDFFGGLDDSVFANMEVPGLEPATETHRTPTATIETTAVAAAQTTVVHAKDEESWQINADTSDCCPPWEPLIDIIVASKPSNRFRIATEHQPSAKVTMPSASSKVVEQSLEDICSCLKAVLAINIQGDRRHYDVAVQRMVDTPSFPIANHSSIDTGYSQAILRCLDKVETS